MSTAVEELKAMVEKAGKIITNLNQLAVDQEHFVARLSKELDEANAGVAQLRMERDGLLVEIAATEATCAQMRAALEKVMERWDEVCLEGFLRTTREEFSAVMVAALATDVGKSWVSPQDASQAAAVIEDALTWAENHLVLPADLRDEWRAFVKRARSAQSALKESR